MSKAKLFKLALHVDEVVAGTLLEAIDAFFELLNFPWSGKYLGHFKVDVSVNGGLYKCSSAFWRLTSGRAMVNWNYNAFVKMSFGP